MRVDVDYELVFNAIEKLETGKAMTDNEKKSIVKVLEAVQGDYIPTKEEYDLQVSRVETLKSIKEPNDYFQKLLGKCVAYESKYM